MEYFEFQKEAALGFAGFQEDKYMITQGLLRELVVSVQLKDRYGALCFVLTWFLFNTHSRIA